ncbi:MAG: SAM-dependent chlorinase/fluorinase [Firmicutes bacterium]|nr:SAM-dependent chlorinase/fluorinase [Bacillota bacterium]
MSTIRNNCIALLTDFGLTDPYTGLMKAVIKNINPNTDIIDITHNIQPQNISQACFLLSKSYGFFPEGTIFISVVDPGVGGRRKPIAVKTDKYTFLSPDNGLLSFLIPGRAKKKEHICEIREITNPVFILKHISRTFHGRDIFSPAAAHLSAGTDFSGIGEKITEIRKLNTPDLICDNGKIRGNFIFADHFGNLITDIEKSFIDECSAHCENKFFRINAGEYTFNRLNGSYEESEKGELLAIIGSYDTLEISANCGNAAEAIPRWKEIRPEIDFKPTANKELQ